MSLMHDDYCNLKSSYLARDYLLITSVISTVETSVREPPNSPTASSKTINRIGTDGVLDLRADPAKRIFNAHGYSFNETINSSNTKNPTPLSSHCPNGIQGLLATTVFRSKILIKSHHRKHHSHLHVYQLPSSGSSFSVY